MARERAAIQTDGVTPINTDKRKRKRVTVYLNDDGTPDYSGLDETVRSLLSIPSQSAETVTPPIEIPPEMIGYLVLTLTRIEAAIVAPRLDLDVESVLPILTPYPELGNAINTAASKVLAKYGGTMGQYQDEIVLGSLILTWQATAFGQLRALSAEKRLQTLDSPHAVPAREPDHANIKPSPIDHLPLPTPARPARKSASIPMPTPAGAGNPENE